MKRTILLLLLVGGSAWLVLSATLPKNIIAVLEKVDKTNASYKTVKASLEVVTKMGGISTSMEGELWMDNQAGKFRVLYRTGPTRALMLYDGETLWNYMEANKTYLKQRLPREEVEKNWLLFLPPAVAFSPICKKSFNSESFLKSLGKSTMGKAVLNKKSVFVITFVDKEDNTQIKLTVDAKEYRILQIGIVVPSEENGKEVTFKIKSFQSNVSFPQDAFAFTPPPDAKEFTPPQGGETMEEQMAPDFSLKALDGKEYTLSALKGKVVLLDFWATWCPPCREEIPIIEKLHREFKDKGLVVLGINDEDRATVEEFVKEKKITFPILMDREGKVAQSYKVEAIPRVILINKEGKIVKDITGYYEGNEKILKEAIENSLSK